MNIKSTLLIGLTLVGTQLISVQSVQADDDKTLTSSACHGTFKGDRDRTEYHTTMMKAKGGEVQHNCGLVRDGMGKKLHWVNVRYKKASTSTSIYGRVYSCNTAYHDCAWKSASSSSNSGMHSVFINTSSLDYSDTYGRIFSYYSRLPEGDSLVSIHYKED